MLIYLFLCFLVLIVDRDEVTSEDDLCSAADRWESSSSKTGYSTSHGDADLRICAFVEDNTGATSDIYYVPLSTHYDQSSTRWL